MKKNELIEIKAGKFLFQGKCLSEIEGKKVFLENCIPDDFVSARVTKVKKDYLEAIAENIIEPSEKRTQERCKHFGICGGCKIQNMKYAEQLLSKQEIVRESFERIGKIKDIKINDIIGADEIFYYRNKMEYSFSNKRWMLNGVDYTGEEKRFALGLHIANRYDKVLQIEECYLQSNFSNKVRNFISEYFQKKNTKIFSLQERDGLLKSLIVRESKNTNDKIINIISTKYDEQLFLDLADEIKKYFPETTSFIIGLSENNLSSSLTYKSINIFGENIIREKILNMEFNVGVNSFFQTNTQQTEKLFSYVKTVIDSDRKDGILLDLFCGVGVIGILLADYFEKVIGIELVEESIHYAKINSEKNKKENCEYYISDLNKGLKNIIKEKIDTVVFDPPRAGLSEQIIKEILELKPRKIIYISCNPTTQARDVNLLKSDYRINLCQPLDLFPHTYHIENVVVMEII